MPEGSGYSDLAAIVQLAAILAKMDNPADPTTVDVLDRAARLLGIIYGDVGQLRQNVNRSAYTIEESPTIIVEGQVTLTGAAQQMPADACRSVTIENPIANAVVAIGPTNAVTLLNGYRLQPGATVSLDIDNVNRMWVIGTLNQIISYLGVN